MNLIFIQRKTSISVGVNLKVPANKALACGVPNLYSCGGRYVLPRLLSDSWFLFALLLINRSDKPLVLPNVAPQPRKQQIALTF